MEIQAINIADVSELKSKLVDQGFAVYQFNTSAVHDRTSFFQAALASLPMGDAAHDPDFSWRFPQNWSALSDFLWQGLSEQQTPVAIVWMGSDELRSNNPELYNEAIDAMAGVSVDSVESGNLPHILFLTRSEMV